MESITQKNPSCLMKDGSLLFRLPENIDAQSWSREAHTNVRNAPTHLLWSRSDHNTLPCSAHLLEYVPSFFARGGRA